jgi:hypothetical protein
MSLVSWLDRGGPGSGGNPGDSGSWSRLSTEALAAAVRLRARLLPVINRLFVDFPQAGSVASPMRKQVWHTMLGARITSGGTNR